MECIQSVYPPFNIQYINEVKLIHIATENQKYKQSNHNVYNDTLYTLTYTIT